MTECGQVVHNVCMYVYVTPIPPCYRVKMKQAYDFALEHVGIDFHSTTLWTDYISFLKSEYVLSCTSCIMCNTILHSVLAMSLLTISLQDV